MKWREGNMGLTCEAKFNGDCEWYYNQPEDYENLAGKRRKRCCSCKTLINIGDLALPFPRWRSPKTDIEESICGDEISLATMYMCEKCGDIAMNLNAIGYCTVPGDDMRELLKEYVELKKLPD
jgi:hypothetical protein